MAREHEEDVEALPNIAGSRAHCGVRLHRQRAPLVEHFVQGVSQVEAVWMAVAWQSLSTLVCERMPVAGWTRSPHPFPEREQGSTKCSSDANDVAGAVEPMLMPDIERRGGRGFRPMTFVESTRATRRKHSPCRRPKK